MCARLFNNNTLSVSVKLTGRSVLSDISPVHPLREHRRVVVDVFQVHLHVSVADQALAAFVLCEHGEPPLRSAVGLISVQWLRENRRFDEHKT